MTDALNKIPGLKALVTSCKDIVTKLHFKADIIETEMQKIQTQEIVAELLDKIEKA